MRSTKDPTEIRKLFQDQLIGKQILQIDTQGVWIDNDGEWHLENVTTIHIEGGLVLSLSGSAQIDDCEVDVTLSNDTETLRTNSDCEYKRVWIN
jgi:hypothetical protein